LMVEAVGELLQRVQEITPSSKEHQHNLKFLSARIEASSWVARRLRGDDLNPIIYMEKTNGVKTEPASHALLMALKDKALDGAKQARIPTADDQSFMAWRIDNQLDTQTTRQLVRMAINDALVAIQSFTDEAVELEYEINPVKSNKYYYAWSRTNYQTLAFTLDLNFHKTKIWTPGKAEELGDHEGGEHLRRMNDWRRQIKKSKMPAVIGQTVVYGPESVVEEGLALTIAHFVPEIYKGLSPEGKFQVDSSILRYVVYGNISLMLNGPNRPTTKNILEYVHEFIPWEPASEIRRQIKWRSNHPIYQVYLPSYAFGARMFLEIIDTLSERGRKQLLKDLSLRPYTPEQLMNRVAELQNGKKNRNESQTSVRSPSNVQALA